MTSSEIKYCVETVLKDSLDVVTPLLGANYITFMKQDTKFTESKTDRFKFDMTNEIVECYKCKKFEGSTIPKDWVLHKNYDIVDGDIYVYLFDPSTLEPYIDYYDFEAVVVIAPKQGGF